MPEKSSRAWMLLSLIALTVAPVALWVGIALFFLSQMSFGSGGDQNLYMFLVGLIPFFLIFFLGVIPASYLFKSGRITARGATLLRAWPIVVFLVGISLVVFRGWYEDRGAASYPNLYYQAPVQQ